MGTPAQAHFPLLFVDDDPGILSALKRVFFEEPYPIHTARDGEKALALLRKTKIEAAILDLKMPGMDGLTLLKKIKKSYPGIMVLMLTGHGGVKEAVEAVKLGADDFLEKPFSPEGLRARLAQIYRLWALSEENRDLRARIKAQSRLDRLIGNAPVMVKLKETISRLGPTEAPVLIQGETGTGKELVARAIHDRSARSKHPFVPIDCAAMNEMVVESELFGHAKGAFTGAHASTLGLIRSAHEGTLFLDEVGELSPAIQAKLLRTIQEREVRPVGMNKRYDVDVRILAATNRDLSEEVASGHFREDLYYRLNVVNLVVTPLRERKEDIPLLARHFLDRLGGVSAPKGLIRAALACLDTYDWPGNVRELENAVCRAVALAKEDTLRVEDFPPQIYSRAERSQKRFDLPAEDSLEAYEQAAIRNALAKSKNNRKKAAQILCVGEATLYRKIKKYGLEG